MDPKPVGLSPRSTVRGRPRTASNRDDPCARCGRNIPRLAATWPEGRLCNICYVDAVHSRGTCPACLQDRLLPGPPNANGYPICSTCAAIPYDFHCERCDIEAGHHRGRLCARCALRDDLHSLLGGEPSNSVLIGLVDVLCASDRPESIIVWKRSSKVQDLLRGLGDGRSRYRTKGSTPCLVGNPSTCAHCWSTTAYSPSETPTSPASSDGSTPSSTGSPTRCVNPCSTSLPGTTSGESAPRQRPERPTRGPVHSAKQEITETVRFLLWLHETYQRTAATCTQQDIDEWLATGPTTRSAIRTFFVVAKQARLNTAVTIQHRSAKTESVPQPGSAARLDPRAPRRHKRVTPLPRRRDAPAALRPAARQGRRVSDQRHCRQRHGMSIRLGQHPTDVPEPFASLLREHLASRPNLRTGGGPDSPWLFPSTLAGRHLHPNTVMDRLRDLGINLLGARNRAIGDLVLECPPSLVAEALGYSPQVAFLHANKAAEPWARYAGRSITRA